VAAVETILSKAAAKSPGPVPALGGKTVVDRALWFCSCSTDEDFEAPTWLVYDTADGRFGWCRVPNGDRVEDMVDAPLIVGDHVHPEQVLSWLRNEDTKWWPGDGEADKAVIGDVGWRIRSLHGD
jgi:hypothetical protein